MQSATTTGPGGTTVESTSRARDFGLRAQKKIFGRFASFGAGRSLLIDDETTSILDNLHKLMEHATKINPHLDKKQPDKVLKNIVKLSVKIGLLHHNRQLTPQDYNLISEINNLIKMIAMAVVSFYELDYSFDKTYLTESLDRCCQCLLTLIRPHLTEKSQQRCNQVFDFLSNEEFLVCVFKQDTGNKAILGSLVDSINKFFESNNL